MPQWFDKYRWFISYAISILLLFVPTILVIGHLGLKIPIAPLIEPMALFVAILLGAGPFLYEGGSRAREDSDARFMMATVTVLFLILLLIGAHFSARLGMVSVEAARGYMFTALMSMPICGGLAYLIARKRAKSR